MLGKKAIAKIAMHIQETEYPVFNNVFINLGAFHLEASYFASLGFMLADSGLPQLLCEAHVIGSNSVAGFLAGKHLSQCSRIHQHLLAALTKVQLNQFVLDTQPNGVIPQSILKTLCDNPHEINNMLNEETDVMDFLLLFECYTESCLNGDYGKITQYLAMYM